MAPRWLRAVGKLLMKRTRKKSSVQFYAPSDEEVSDSDGYGGRRSRAKHAHDDWIAGDVRASVQTSYYCLPPSPQKRGRSMSLPPSLPSLAVTDDTVHSLYDPTAHPLDIDYLYHQLEQLEDDPTPRKRTAGDRPLTQWVPEADTYLDELLRLEGRGDFIDVGCPCGAEGCEAVYRCEDCADRQLYCQPCILASHASHPLHRIKRWESDGYFLKVSLKTLGLCVQLGHEVGEICINSKASWGDDFVVLDVFGIHEVRVKYCACERALPSHVQLLRARWFPATSVNPKTAATFRLLESFHLLSTQSKVSAYEFYISLSRRTDNTGVLPPKDRYPAFLTMVREWRHLKMMKHAGRGNDPEGIAATTEGSCAVECPACPQPGKNIPKDDEEPSGLKGWLRRLFVAVDANFRLKRKKVSSDALDPSLNHGYAYVVEEKAYKQHLATHDNLNVESSGHCNNHDAVKLATLKGAASLAASGVASVDCARHEMKRPCSTGDLQKGERQVNVDYILYSSLRQNVPSQVLASYDIACHYDRHLNERFDKYGFDEPHATIEWAIPKFHINAHRDQCRSEYNLRYIPFCARDDGEAIERLWARTNAAAASTKEMGPGARRDVLDDIFGYHNWQKVIYLPATFLARIKKAVPERNTQLLAFEQYNAALPEDATMRWRQMTEAWEADRSQPNPFELKRPAVTQAAIKRQMMEEDAAMLQAGTAVMVHEKISASGMIISGLELEDSQRRLKTDIMGLSQHATDIQRAKMTERQNLLHRRINAWSEIQQLYMPGVVALRSRLITTKEDASLPYNIPLLLPSSVVTSVSCSAELMEHEWRLRYGQAFDALDDLRGHLEARSHLYKFKDRFVRGQRANTRAQTIIKQVDAKIDADAERYRAAYAALSALASHLCKAEWDVQLRPLVASDIRHVADGEEGQSEGRRTMSWIWQASSSTSNIAGQVQESLQESLRVEWCKARARAARWSEEVELLQEEMRRTITYHEWAAAQWPARVDTKFVERPDYREGANAYARRQAAVRTSLRDFCKRTWQHVPQWVCLGGADADEDENLPDLVSLAETETETEIIELSERM
ncbi:hypothetical protein C8Q76DRAFT_693826 [Earliella scabrosa]|nr:hypothetical protein C8Q76DRAFT_693826 [Earliella scabrosa]